MRPARKSGDLAATLKNFRQTSEELKKAVGENRALLKTTVENFSAASQTTKRLTADREIELKRAFEDFASAAEKMDHLAGRLDSLRGALQSVTTKLDSGQGTLGKLVNDDKLYNDVSAASANISPFRSQNPDAVYRRFGCRPVRSTGSLHLLPSWLVAKRTRWPAKSSPTYPSFHIAKTFPSRTTIAGWCMNADSFCTPRATRVVRPL